MHSLSIWAKQHLYTARLLLVIGQTILAIGAFLMGALFSSIPYFSAEIFKYIGLSLFFIGLIFYPIKHTKWRFLQYSYFRQKCMDAILIFSSIFLFFGMGQQLMKAPTTGLIGATETKTWRAELVVHSRTTNVSPKASKKITRKQKRLERKQLRRHLKKVIKQNKKELSEGMKALLIIGTLLLASFLLSFLMYLSCSLACSGMDILAAITIGAGGPLVITLAVLAIRRVSGKTTKMQEL